MIVADDDWDQKESEYKGNYLIRTVDGREIKATRFAKTDSSLILYEYNSKEESENIPLEIPENEIESIEETKFWWLGTVAGGTICIGVVGYTAWLAYFAYGFSHATW